MSVFPIQDRELYVVNEIKLPQQHNVLVDDPDVQSMAALKKLNAYYKSLGGCSTKKLHRQTRLHNSKKKFLAKAMAAGPLVCFYCNHKLHLQPPGKSRQDRWSATIDHVIPLSKNPTLAFDHANMRIACGDCNSRKGNKLELDMAG